jgi:hypothetical protein
LSKAISNGGGSGKSAASAQRMASAIITPITSFIRKWDSGTGRRVMRRRIIGTGLSALASTVAVALLASGPRQAR